MATPPFALWGGDCLILFLSFSLPQNFLLVVHTSMTACRSLAALSVAPKELDILPRETL